MTQEDMIKGRIAEAIVKCMFEDLGFEVIPYGYEHTCPTIAKKDRLIKGDVKNIIRKAPDFIIIDKEGNVWDPITRTWGDLKEKEYLSRLKTKIE